MVDRRANGQTPTKRLDLVERDLRDHARSLSELTNAVGEWGKRVAQLEEAQMSYRLYMAREEERDKALQVRLAGIETSLEKISGGFNKLLWIIGTSIIGAFAAFIINGGLKLP